MSAITSIKLRTFINDVLPDLTEAELREVNQHVVLGIRSLAKYKQDEASKQFRVGDLVGWGIKYGQPMIGTVQKVNRNSLTLIQCHVKGLPVSSGVASTWRVSPSFLHLVGKP